MTSRLQHAPGIEAISIDDDVLTFDGTDIHLMSGTAAAIWSAIDGHGDEQRVADQLSARYGSPPDAVSQTAAYIHQLRERGLVVDIEASSSDSTIHTVPEHVAWTTDGDLVVTLDLRTGERFTLSETASRIWQLVVDGATPDAAARQLALDFPDAPDDVASVIATLCRELVVRGLLSRIDA